MATAIMNTLVGKMIISEDKLGTVCWTEMLIRTLELLSSASKRAKAMCIFRVSNRCREERPVNCNINFYFYCPKVN